MMNIWYFRACQKSLTDFALTFTNSLVQVMIQEDIFLKIHMSTLIFHVKALYVTHDHILVRNPSYLQTYKSRMKKSTTSAYIIVILRLGIVERGSFKEDYTLRKRLYATVLRTNIYFESNRISGTSFYPRNIRGFNGLTNCHPCYM